MLRTHFHKNIIWYDFIQLNEESNDKNFQNLVKEKNIHPYIVKKFLTKTNRDKALLLNDNLYLSLHFPDLKHDDYVSQEIKFIIGRNYIITNQEIENEGLAKFKTIFESNASFEKDDEKDSCVVYVFLHMIEKIYENMIFELGNLGKRIEKIEENIFKDKEKYMVKKISETNRDLLDFKRNIRSHEETWKVFLDLSKKYFRKETSHTALESILISYKKTETQAQDLSELIHDLRDTNNSLLSAKQGDMSKTFTLITFLTMPATLFYTIISLPAAQSFFGKHVKDFWEIMYISFGLFFIMLLYTIYKKWW